MPKLLAGLRFVAGILFVCVGLASILHVGPAYLLWYSTVAVQLYIVLLFIGIAILIVPYFYSIAGSNAAEKAAVLKFDFAFGLSAIGIGFMLLLTLISSNENLVSLDWIPLVLAVYIALCATLFKKSPHLRVAGFRG